MGDAATNVALVGAGGFIGSALRYGVHVAAHRAWPQLTFPLSTLAVNVVGCLLIGFVAGLADSRQLTGQTLRLFVVVGLLGGFTTFSTFGFETFALFRDGQTLRALLNVCLNAVSTVVAVAGGYHLARVL